MNLAEWLDYQQTVHPRGIDMGLTRVREVATRLNVLSPAPRVITVAGTNGKGSTVAFAENIARAAGYRVGVYTSPHLLRYNERVRVQGVPVDDARLIAAFEAIDGARGDISLTFFEYGTLAALWIFSREALDLVVLEVGLGGRLDAVNVVDASVAIITTIALDHTDYLGPDVDSIAREKAGVMRAGSPVVIGTLTPPLALKDEAERLGAQRFQAGENYRFERRGDGWCWSHAGQQISLPMPGLTAPSQLANASAALMAIKLMTPPLIVSDEQISQAIATTRLAGRLQLISGEVDVLLDVAHNPQAAQQLAQWLEAHPIAGRNVAVFAALSDKDVVNEVVALDARIDQWYLAGLTDGAGRGQTIEALWQKLEARLPEDKVSRRSTVAEALADAKAQAEAGDRLVVFGSFHTVAEAMAHLSIPI